MIIDKSNWQANRPGPGDFLLNAASERIGVVTAVARRTGVVTVEAQVNGSPFRYKLDGGRSGFETLIEFKGYRFERSDA